MENDNETEEKGWEIKALRLQEELDGLKEISKVSSEKERSGKALCDRAIAMIHKLEEISTNKDFRTAMAIAEAQGFRYTGPWIKEAAGELATSIQTFQMAWKA